MKYSSRFFLYAPLALFLLIAVGAGVMWWIEAGRLSDRLDAMNGREVMPGVTLSFKSKSVSGFPFNLDVVFDDVRLTVKTPHGPSMWASEKFALHALTYGRETMLFEAAGRQALNWTTLDGRRRTLAFEVGELHASAISGPRGVTRIDIDLRGFGSPALTAARLQFHARTAPDGRAIEIVGAADAVHLSPPLASLFGEDVTSIKLNASASQARTFDGLRAGRTDWVSALETWRKADGSLHVSDLEIAWDKLSAMGKGQLGLAESHAVEGMLDFKVAGIHRLIEKAAQRRIQPDSFRGIAAALLARAAKAGNNEAGLLGAVVGFHAGIVSVGDVPATTEEPLY